MPLVKIVSHSWFESIKLRETLKMIDETFISRRKSLHLCVFLFLEEKHRFEKLKKASNQKINEFKEYICWNNTVTWSLIKNRSVHSSHYAWIAQIYDSEMCPQSKKDFPMRTYNLPSAHPESYVYEPDLNVPKKCVTGI